VDLRAVIHGDVGSGVPHGEALVQFAEAAVEAGPGAPGGCREDPALVETRDALLQALGSEALVDAAAVVGNFQRMDRIADATGIPLDAPVDLLTADLRHRLGIDGYAAAAHTPGSGALKRSLAGVLRRVATTGLRLARRRRRSRG
jgi:hypothetical protein